MKVVFLIFCYFFIEVFSQEAQPAITKRGSSSEQELLQHIQTTNEKLLAVINENKETISQLKNDVVKKLKEESDKNNKRHEEMSQKMTAVEKKMDHKIDALKQDVKEGQSSKPNTNTNTDNNDNNDVSSDFKTMVIKRFISQAKWLLHNDVAIHRIIAVLQQLRNRVMNPTQYNGCPLGWMRGETSCIHVGPKATFHEAKKYCELFNAKMVSTETTYGEQVANNLIKYYPELKVWMYRDLPKNHHVTDYGFILDVKESLKDMNCTAFIPLKGKWVTANCNKQFSTMCQIDLNGYKHDVVEFTGTKDKMLSI